MDEGQSVDKDGDVVAVGTQPRVDCVLVDDLHLVAMDVGLVDEADVLGRAVVAGEDLHVVLLDTPCFGDHGVGVSGGYIDDIVAVEAPPFIVAESVVVKGFELGTQVCFEAGRVVDVRVLVGLATQLVDEGIFEGCFALVVPFLLAGRLVEADDREVVGKDDGFNAGARFVGGHSRSFLYGSRSRPGLASGRLASRFGGVDPMLTSPTVICVQAAPRRQLKDKPEACSTCLMKPSTPRL